MGTPLQLITLVSSLSEREKLNIIVFTLNYMWAKINQL